MVKWPSGGAYIAPPLGGLPSVEAFFEEVFGRGQLKQALLQWNVTLLEGLLKTSTPPKSRGRPGQPGRKAGRLGGPYGGGMGQRLCYVRRCYGISGAAGLCEEAFSERRRSRGRLGKVTLRPGESANNL